jgi:hypothetical protein
MACWPFQTTSIPRLIYIIGNMSWPANVWLTATDEMHANDRWNPKTGRDRRLHHQSHS